MFPTILLLSLSLCVSVYVEADGGHMDPEKYSALNKDNYTSCKDFLENTTFEVKKVVDVDWKIFYFWSPTYEESYNIKFSLVTKTLVDRYRVELEGQLNPPVNWTNALLFMETSVDFSALMIKTEIDGIFRAIPSLAFEFSGAPSLLFAMKVVDPGYLGILNCKYKLCYALAPVDKMPNHEYLKEEAQKLGFWSDFGRSHIAMHPAFPKLPTDPFHMDDDDEDEHLEILHHDDIQFL